MAEERAPWLALLVFAEGELSEDPPGPLGETAARRGLPQARSWLGNGPNETVTADEVAAALGEDTLADLAGRSGRSRDEVAATVAAELPGFIDSVSPDGKIDARLIQSQAATLGDLDVLSQGLDGFHDWLLEQDKG